MDINSPAEFDFVCDELTQMAPIELGYLLKKTTKPHMSDDKNDLKLLDKIRPTVKQIIINYCQAGFDQLAKVCLFGNCIIELILKDLKPNLKKTNVWSGLVSQAQNFQDKLPERSEATFLNNDEYEKECLAKILLSSTYTEDGFEP